ncbi:MAG: ABC transporter permease [Patescibacteria group bacterium]|nr:ABC transporter permease [Patescibacteria group bacterium]
MKFYRVKALLMRNLYLYKRSLPRIMDILYWPVMELLIWGFLSVYLEKLNFGGVSVVTVLLGGILFWELLSRAQGAVSVAFLEDVWERNFLNIFVTPLKTIELLAAWFLIGLVRIVLVGIVAGGLAFLFYKFNIFTFGIYLIPFVLNLLLFGWIAGLFAIGIILRYGSSAQIIAWGILFLIQPFVAVFYPVSALPQSIQWICWILPPTYVFEGMRTVLATGVLPFRDFLLAAGTNAIYLVLVVWFFFRMFARVKEKGLLLKLD